MQDINNVIKKINTGWANDLSNAKTGLAVAEEKAERLESENARLQEELNKLKKEIDNNDDD
ncbi:hypothetical protein JNUCC1_03363 [Lentibacillus sp. JNUCC-1]|uniref:hypothetical protein n=1 Tax=Lentibacillus sp. JNUCC-1 TaxID=2654513 RepID=UPI0012E7156F|nr:hypothetical protein [Lentibacillus sp. JNUCC-1]MUV39485.1 hypothetical protein [Lentibacillus sp. JNUCC-1]